MQRLFRQRKVWLAGAALALWTTGCHGEAKHDGHATQAAHADHAAAAKPAAPTAAPADPHAAHGDHGAGGGQLTLDDGKKWQTDEALRAGMTAVRDDVQAAIEPIHAGRFTPADATALAERIDKRLQTVVAQCKLPPAADQQLHIVLMQLFGATDAMKKGDVTKGAVQAISAVNAYGAHFDHPGWRPIEH